MARILNDGACVWLSAQDTEDWATRPGHYWPCSTLRGRRVFAEFHGTDLVDLQLDGGRGDQDCDANEFNACVSDFLAARKQKLGRQWLHDAEAVLYPE
jgi:hypothetical protein